MLLVVSDFLFDSVEFGLKCLCLLLESGYGIYVVVNWVVDMCVCFVDKVVCGVGMLVFWYFY